MKTLMNWIKIKNLKWIIDKNLFPPIKEKPLNFHVNVSQALWHLVTMMIGELAEGKSKEKKEQSFNDVQTWKI